MAVASFLARRSARSSIFSQESQSLAPVLRSSSLLRSLALRSTVGEAEPGLGLPSLGAAPLLAPGAARPADRGSGPLPAETYWTELRRNLAPPILWLDVVNVIACSLYFADEMAALIEMVGGPPENAWFSLVCEFCCASLWLLAGILIIFDVDPVKYPFMGLGRRPAPESPEAADELWLAALEELDERLSSRMAQEFAVLGKRVQELELRAPAARLSSGHLLEAAIAVAEKRPLDATPPPADGHAAARQPRAAAAEDRGSGVLDARLAALERHLVEAKLGDAGDVAPLPAANGLGSDRSADLAGPPEGLQPIDELQALEACRSGAAARSREAGSAVRDPEPGAAAARAAAPPPALAAEGPALSARLANLEASVAGLVDELCSSAELTDRLRARLRSLAPAF